MAVFDLRGQVSADVSPFNRAMDASAKAAAGAFSDMASAAGMFIGNGVIRHFVRATSAANLFGQKMADISAIADYNIKSLRTSILGLENVYGRASNVANTMYEIISSGIRGSTQDVLAYQKAAAHTAVSIKADLYDTAKAMTNLTNAYDTGIAGVNDIADMLFVTVREGKANGNELARTLGLVTPTAAEAGVAFSELAAAISILSRTQSASQSMIGLNQLLNAIIKPTQEAQQEARRWGIELSATALKTKGLAGVLQELHEKTGGNVRALNAMLGNIRAMRAGVSLTGNQFENFMSVLKMAEAEIGTGVAFEAFKKQTNTAAQAVENLRTQIDKTYIQMGKDIEPLTVGLATYGEVLLKTFAEPENTIGRWAIAAGAIALSIKGTKATVGLFRKSTKDIAVSSSSIQSSTGSIAANLKASVANAQALLAAMQKITLVNTSILSSQSQMLGIGATPIALTTAQQRRAALSAVKSSKAAIEAEARANIESIYPRNAAGRLYDPSNKSRLVSEKALIDAEINRIRTSRLLAEKQLRQAQLLERYNRRFGTSYTSLDQIHNTAARFKTAAGKLISGIGKAAMGMALWGSLAVTAGTMLQSLIKQNSDKEVEAINAAADKRDIPKLRQIAYNKLSAVYSAKTINDAEYRAYFSAITLADNREALAKLYNDIRNKEITNLKKPTFSESLSKLKDDYETDLANTLGVVKKGGGKPSPNTLVNIERGYSNNERTLSGMELPKLRWLTDVGLDEYVEVERDNALIDPQHKVRLSDKFKTALMRAMQETDWESALLPLETAVSKGKAHPSLVVSNLAASMSAEIRKAKYTRSFDAAADQAKAENVATRDAQLRFFDKYIGEVHKHVQDAIIDEAQKTRASADTPTIDAKSGYSAASLILSDLEALKSRAVANNENIKQATFDLLHTPAYTSALSDEDKSRLKKRLDDRFSTAAIHANEMTDYINDLVKEHTSKVMSEYDLRRYDSHGNALNANSLATVLRDMLTQQYGSMSRTVSPAAKRAYKEAADSLATKLNELISDTKEKRDARNQSRVDAGLMTDKQRLQDDVLFARSVYNVEYGRLRREHKGTVGYTEQQKRTAEAELELRAAILKLKSTTEETASSMRSNLMGQIKNFAKDRDSKGRMTNDALYHSINLMSRLGGGTAIQTSKGMRISVGNGRFANFKDAQSAQTAVSRSLDAYIMSQQYAEANKGRTVVDIYNLLKQNIGKGITVN